MRRILVLVLAGLFAGAVALRAHRPQSARAAVPAPPGAQFSSDGKLVRPEDYRRWVYVSSGFGMSYNPGAGENGAPAFTNVFVVPAAYDFFRAHGTWPDKTAFVLEIYSSASHGSINQKGSYQESLVGLDVEVKDESRFADKWAYFNFDESSKSAPANPKTACWQCHEDHAAVEHSFVQFYPTLKPVAKKFGTYKEAAENP